MHIAIDIVAELEYKIRSTPFYIKAYRNQNFLLIMGMPDFSDQFRKVIIHNKRFGYNLNDMRQSAC